MRKNFKPLFTGPSQKVSSTMRHSERSYETLRYAQGDKRRTICRSERSEEISLQPVIARSEGNEVVPEVDSPWRTISETYNRDCHVRHRRTRNDSRAHLDAAVFKNGVGLKGLFISLLFVCSILVVGSLSAEELESQEPPLTISWVVEEALRSNPDIQASLNRWEASQEAVDSARSLDDPKVMFSLRNAKNPVQFEGPEWRRYERMGTFSQEIPFPGKLRLRGRIASEASEMSRKDWEETIRIITAQAKAAYYRLHYIHKAIDINKENKDLLEKFAKIAETRYKVGKAPQRDVLAAQVELARIINDLEILEEEIRSAETRINTLLNRDPEAPLGRPEDYTQHKLPLTLQDVETLAIKNRPELQKFDYAIKRDKSSLRLAKKDLYFPDPEFAVHYMQVDPHADMWRSEIGINIPWIWGKNRAKVREAKEAVQAAEADYQAVQNSVLFEVKDFWVKATNAQTTTKIYSESVIPLAEQSLKAAITEYETEKIDFLTLIDSERTLLDVELEYYRALTDFETNLAELEKAVGIPLTQDEL